MHQSAKAAFGAATIAHKSAISLVSRRARRLQELELPVLHSSKKGSKGRLSRRRFALACTALAGTVGVAAAFHRRAFSKLAQLTESSDFTATPQLTPHDPATERRQLWVNQGGTPAENIDGVLAKLGGIEQVVGQDDVVILKVSAQWWNQGMTNVAAVRRMIERILERPGFRGEVVVFENTHFRLANGSGLSRAWTHPSERNVDVEGWTKLGDLVSHFAALKSPVSFVGLVDAGFSELSGAAWYDPKHEHGVYGGDGRGPIEPGEERDGYVWDFSGTFEKRKGPFELARTPLSWPVFTSPRSGITVDFRHGLYRRDGGQRIPVERKLTWITMSTVNEHSATGLTACCKSSMGVVDMSAGRLGTDPRVADYQSVHYFGFPNAKWRMSGPLAHFAKTVRSPDLYLAVAEWVGITPAERSSDTDLRLAADCARHTRTVVAGRDPVSIDYWCAKHLLKPIGGKYPELWDVEDPQSQLSRFLRYYREVYGAGTMDSQLIEVA